MFLTCTSKAGQDPQGRRSCSVESGSEMGPQGWMGSVVLWCQGPRPAPTPHHAYTSARREEDREEFAPPDECFLPAYTYTAVQVPSRNQGSLWKEKRWDQGLAASIVETQKLDPDCTDSFQSFSKCLWTVFFVPRHRESREKTDTGPVLKMFTVYRGRQALIRHKHDCVNCDKC